MLFSWTIPPSPSPTESIRVCLQSCPASPSFPMSQLLPSLNQMANVLEFQLQYQSFQWIFRAGIFWDWLVWSPCCPKDYQDSSSITVWKHQFLRVQPSLWSNSHIHTWLLEKSQLWLYGQLIAKWCLCFLIHCLGLSKFFFFFFSKKQVSFNFLAAVTIHSDFGAEENKICHCFHFFLIYLPWSDGTGWHDLRFF